MAAFFRNDNKRTILFMVVSASALIASFFGGGALPVNPAWVAVVLCGIPILKGAVVGLVTAFDIKADVLVAIALVASVIIGELFAAGEVALIMTIGAWLEERTVAKARAGIERLVRLTPTTARVLRGGAEQVIPAQQVRQGDILRVLAGETIAVDGVITAGETSVDQSVMTGESLPVDKTVGDEVSSGTVNQFGAFEMEAQKVGEDSSLQRMIRLVESADADKAKIVGVADRWATWIVVIALVAAGLTWLLSGEIIRAVTILVVFCPCALVLATPTAIMAGIGNATRYGILVRQGDALERLAGVKRIAFDKTGTITQGRLRVAAVQSCCDALSEAELLQLAAGAECRSEHPLGRAIAAHYREQTGAPHSGPAAFEMLPGRGVQAQVDGAVICAGNELLLRQNGIALPPALATSAQRAVAEGSTVVYIARDGEAVGLIALADTLRPEAADTVRAIHSAGFETMLLTGDGPEAARHMAGAVGIEEVRARCLPQDKLDIIRDFEQAGEGVCMVGDGVNDAPALKAARVGIAMGGIGSDIAIDAADIALVSDDIRQLPHLLLLAKKTMRTIHINLAASMLLNFAAIILAILGILNPVVGALVHNAGSVAVILNSALLLKWRQRRADRPAAKQAPARAAQARSGFSS